VNGKPVAFVSYGGVPPERSVGQLRQVVAELQMFDLRDACTSRWSTAIDARGAQDPGYQAAELTLASSSPPPR